MDSTRRPLPEELDDLSLDELKEAAIATARLMDRSRYDLGRALNRIRKEGSLKLGYASVTDFAESELGIRAREAYHLMRIDRLIEALPRLREAYARGEVSFSSVRVLVQVATPDDEERWVELARSSNA